MEENTQTNPAIKAGNLFRVKGKSNVFIAIQNNDDADCSRCLFYKHTCFSQPPCKGLYFDELSEDEIRDAKKNNIKIRNYPEY